MFADVARGIDSQVPLHDPGATLPKKKQDNWYINKWKKGCSESAKNADELKGVEYKLVAELDTYDQEDGTVVVYGYCGGRLTGKNQVDYIQWVTADVSCDPHAEANTRITNPLTTITPLYSLCQSSAGRERLSRPILARHSQLPVPSSPAASKGGLATIMSIVMPSSTSVMINDRHSRQPLSGPILSSLPSHESLRTSMMGCSLLSSSNDIRDALRIL